MRNTLENLENAIAMFADACRTGESDEKINELFHIVIGAGVDLYKDKTCPVYTDAESGWEEEDRFYLTLFTSMNEITQDVNTFAEAMPASKLFDIAYEYDIYDGIVINPYSPNLFTFDGGALEAVIVMGSESE